MLAAVPVLVAAAAAVLAVTGAGAHDGGRPGAAGEHREGRAGRSGGDGLPGRDPDLSPRSPYAAVNQADGVYTELPASGDKIGCGDVLYRVDDAPGAAAVRHGPGLPRPARGHDGPGRPAAQPNLHLAPAAASPRARRRHSRGSSTPGACTRPERSRSAPRSSCPKPVRIAKVSGQLGGAARPGAPVLSATSDQLLVQVALDPSEQGAVKKGDRAQITLPGNTPVSGRVEGFGRVAQTRGRTASPPTRPSRPTSASTTRRRRAGSTRLRSRSTSRPRASRTSSASRSPRSSARSGGGFAVEVVRAGGRRDLVAVQLGLFDTGGGRVQVDGALRAGDSVVVPSL